MNFYFFFVEFPMDESSSTSCGYHSSEWCVLFSIGTLQLFTKGKNTTLIIGFSGILIVNRVICLGRIYVGLCQDIFNIVLDLLHSLDSTKIDNSNILVINIWCTKF